VPCRVAGRVVYLNTKNTQTVKVCTARNLRGEYERYYRIFPPYVLPQDQIESKVGRFTNLDAMDQWLMEDRRASRENDCEVAPTPSCGEPAGSFVPTMAQLADEDSDPESIGAAVSEVLDLLASARYRPADDPWLSTASRVVDSAIDRLVEEFLEFPYLHRVEHSIHAYLFRLITASEVLDKRVPIGGTGVVSQLVHKEWPETVGREKNRRGNFDLAVLSPKLLQTCPSVRSFREGRLEAPIVIEIGLDYDAEHLANDAKKLINSKPRYGYLIHLVREFPREGSAEQILLGIEAKFGIKTAYGWVGGQERAFKRVNDAEIVERRADATAT